jgi:hypothetical protein
MHGHTRRARASGVSGGTRRLRTGVTFVELALDEPGGLVQRLLGAALAGAHVGDGVA